MLPRKTQKPNKKNTNAAQPTASNKSEATSNQPVQKVEKETKDSRQSINSFEDKATEDSKLLHLDLPTIDTNRTVSVTSMNSAASGASNRSKSTRPSISVLFSAPLAYRDKKGVLRPMECLNFDVERELLWQV